MSTDLTNKDFWNSRWNDERGSRGRAFLLTNREGMSVMTKVLSHLSPHSKMLELGIAPGSVTSVYHQLRPDLTCDGLDISDKGVAITQKRYQAEGIRGDVHLASFRDQLPKLQSQYDLVCSHGLIEHFDDFDQVIREHIKFAKPGGLIFITIPNYASWPVRSLLNAFSKETVEAHNFNCMSLEALSKAYEKQNVEQIVLSSYGGAILPNTAVNPGMAGKIFKRVAQAWNFSVSLLSYLSFGSLNLRLWQSNHYFILRKLVSKS